MADNAPLVDGLHHSAVSTTRYDETVRFYTDVLGGRVATAWESGARRLCLIDMGDGSHIEVLGESEAEEGRPPLAHTAFRVPDVDRAIERARAAGCQVTIEPRDVQLGSRAVRIAFFTGPNGEVLEFFQERD